MGKDSGWAKFSGYELGGRLFENLAGDKTLGKGYLKCSPVRGVLDDFNA